MEEEAVYSFGKLEIGKYKFWDYECPKIILLKKEEQRIDGSWKRIIMKMLGRRIKYKSLENHLNQMSVRKRVINIVDLAQDYYLVKFTNEED